MGRLNDAAAAKLQRDLDRAKDAGHNVDNLVTTRKGVPGVQHGTRAVCSCGWESTPRGRRVLAAMAGLWHAQEVCAALDDRKRLDLVEWSAAPSSDDLHRQSRHRSVLAGDTPAQPR